MAAKKAAAQVPVPESVADFPSMEPPKKGKKKSEYNNCLYSHKLIH